MNIFLSNLLTLLTLCSECGNELYSHCSFFPLFPLLTVFLSQSPLDLELPNKVLALNHCFRLSFAGIPALIHNEISIRSVSKGLAAFIAILHYHEISILFYKCILLQRIGNLKELVLQCI